MKVLLLLFIFAIFSPLLTKDIASAYGEAGFYYDINGGGTCGPANNITSFKATTHVPMCEGSNPNPETLNQYETNNIVAIPGRLFKYYRDDFCGKRIIVSINGKERNDLNLVVWDGYDDKGDSGLRFSSSIFAELFGKDKCQDRIIHRELSWKITDTQVIPYDKAAGGGLICVNDTGRDTPDNPYDDGIEVAGLVKICAKNPQNLPIDTPFDDNIIVPGMEEFEIFEDEFLIAEEDPFLIDSPFADVIVPGMNIPSNHGNSLRR